MGSCMAHPTVEQVLNEARDELRGGNNKTAIAMGLFAVARAIVELRDCMSEINVDAHISGIEPTIEVQGDVDVTGRVEIST